MVKKHLAFAIGFHDQEPCHVERLSNAWDITRGIIGRTEPEPGNGFWLVNTGAIHTFFVSYPIDIIFTDSRYQVVGIQRSVRPWTLYCGATAARHTFELRQGTIDHCMKDVDIGDELLVTPVA